jgi:cell shape-determining protein MreC
LAKFFQRPNLKPFLYLGFLLLLWLLVPPVVKLTTKSTFDEFHAPLWEASIKVKDLSHYWGHISDSKNTLIEKGRDFQRVISDANVQISRQDELLSRLKYLRELKSEINVLEKSIGLSGKNVFLPIISRITLRKISGWHQNLYVNKGKESNIVGGLGVIFQDGLAGRVESSRVGFAEIQLVTNQSFRIVAHLKGDNRPITFCGNGVLPGGQGYGIISDVPQDIVVSTNSPLEVVTSSLGGKFPRGIHIGYVYELESSIDGLFKTGRVLLPSKLNEIEEVTILLKK